MIVKSTDGIEFLIDEEDYKEVSSKYWFFIQKDITKLERKVLTVKCTDKITNKNYTLSRIIMNPRSREVFIDHISGDRLDNRKSNLRFSNRSLNAHNIQKHKIKGFNGYKGVIKYGNKFQAKITKNRKPCIIGYFETPEEAAIEYNKKALEIYGEYASLNTI